MTRIPMLLAVFAAALGAQQKNLPYPGELVGTFTESSTNDRWHVAGTIKLEFKAKIDLSDVQVRAVLVEGLLPETLGAKLFKAIRAGETVTVHEGRVRRAYYGPGSRPHLTFAFKIRPIPDRDPTEWRETVSRSVCLKDCEAFSTTRKK